MDINEERQYLKSKKFQFFDRVQTNNCDEKATAKPIILEFIFQPFKFLLIYAYI